MHDSYQVIHSSMHCKPFNMMLIGSLKFPAISPQTTVLTEKLQTSSVMEERSNEQMRDVVLCGLEEQLPQSVSMLY